MEINRDLLKDLSSRLPYGVRGYVTIEIPTGEYDINSGHMLYDEKDILVELLGINVDGGEIEVMPVNEMDLDIDLCEYDYTVNDFTPILRPMESLPDDERKNMLDAMFDITMKNLQEKANGDKTLNPASDVYCINFLMERHYDVNRLIPKRLAAVVTEKNDPYSEK